MRDPAVELLADMRRKVSKPRGISEWVYLQAPLTSTSWDGDAKAASTAIDLSTVFSVPAGVRAVLVRLEISDETAGVFASLGPDSSYSTAVGQTTQVNAVRINASGVVPCDASGDVYFFESGELDYVKIEIWGYYL